MSKKNDYLRGLSDAIRIIELNSNSCSCGRSRCSCSDGPTELEMAVKHIKSLISVEKKKIAKKNKLKLKLVKISNSWLARGAQRIRRVS